MEDNGAGMDYGKGITNIDPTTGIRYGVIPANSVGQAWWDESEEECIPFCPYCGEGPLDGGFDAQVCPDCHRELDEDDWAEVTPARYTYEDDGYVCEQMADDPDIFVAKSPFYTLCRFCSPCAPGAGHLLSPSPNGVRTYCLGHDWFEDGRAPYPVYRVDTGEEVMGGNNGSV